jgi:hypothetical protein
MDLDFNPALVLGAGGRATTSSHSSAWTNRCRSHRLLWCVTSDSKQGTLYTHSATEVFEVVKFGVCLIRAT